MERTDQLWTVHEGRSLVAFVRDDCLHVDIYLLLTLNRVQTISVDSQQTAGHRILSVAFGGAAVLLLAVLVAAGVGSKHRTVELFKANDDGVLVEVGRLEEGVLGEDVCGVEWVSNVEGDFVLVWSEKKVSLISASSGNKVLSFGWHRRVHRVLPARRHLVVVDEHAGRNCLSLLAQNEVSSRGCGGVRTKHVWIRRDDQTECRIVEDEESVVCTRVDFLRGGVKECVARVEGSRTIVVVLDASGWLHVLGETCKQEAIQSWVVELSLDICSTLHMQSDKLVWSLVPHVDKRCQSRPQLVSAELSSSSLSISTSCIVAPVTALLLAPPSYRGSHKMVDDFDSSPWSIYVACTDWLGRISEIRFDAGLSSDPRLVVDVKIASWSLDSGVWRLPMSLLIPLPVMTEDRPVFVSHPSVGCLRLASRPRPLLSSIHHTCVSLTDVISVQDDLVFTLDTHGLFRLFHSSSPAGLDAPVSVQGAISCATFLSKPTTASVQGEPFSPFSPSAIPAAALAFVSAAAATPTVSFGCVYLPATPWTRDALRLVAEVALADTPGRVLLLKAEDGSRLLAVVELGDSGSGDFDFVSLVDRRICGRRRLERIRRVLDVCALPSQPLLVLAETVDSVALYRECDAGDWQQLSVTTGHKQSNVAVSGCVSAEAMAVQWTDGVVQIYSLEGETLLTVATAGGVEVLAFECGGLMLVSGGKGLLAVRERHVHRGEHWRSVSAAGLTVDRHSLSVRATTVRRTKTSLAVYVWSERGVEVEQLTGAVVQSVASNSFVEPAVERKFLRLFGGEHASELGDLDYCGRQYVEYQRVDEAEMQAEMVGWGGLSCGCEKSLLVQTREWTQAGYWVREGRALVELCEQKYREGIVRYKQSRKIEEVEQVSIWLSVLGKQQLLSSLYKQHGDHSSARVAEFLSSDFSLEDNRVRAMKNGIELIRQKRYTLAIAVFILADQLDQVVDICTTRVFLLSHQTQTEFPGTSQHALAVFILKTLQATLAGGEARRTRIETLLRRLSEESTCVYVKLVNWFRTRQFEAALGFLDDWIDRVGGREGHVYEVYVFVQYLVKEMKKLSPQLELSAKFGRLKTMAHANLVHRRLGKVLTQIENVDK